MKIIKQSRIWLPILCFTIIIPSRSLKADVSNIKFVHLTIDDGLSHSKVNCIYQDRRGLIWFGTNEGLDKYDGYDFHTYQLDPDNPNSISANLIRCIFEDSQDRFWVGTEAGGLNLYDRSHNRFLAFNNDSTSELILSSSDVNDILEDRQGNIWLGTGSGIEVINIDKKTVYHFQPYPDMGQSDFNQVNVLYMDRDDNIWVGTNGGGLCLFDRQQKQFICFRHDESKIQSISDDEIRSIYEDNDGDLWIGTYNGGLNRFNKLEKTFDHYYPNTEILESLTIKSILEDKNGILWLGTRNGLYFFDRKTIRFDHHINDPKDVYSLIQNNVETIFQDIKGDLWIGTWGGISYLNSHTLPFSHYRAEKNSEKHLNHNVVYAILEDRHGDLWLGTEEGGLNYLNRKTGLFTFYTHDPQDPHTISINNIKALLEDRSGNIWVGTWQGGVNRFDRRRRRFEKLTLAPDRSSALPVTNVMALLEDREGTIWMGTDGNGLLTYDPRRSRYIHMVYHQIFQDYQNIFALLEDRDGTLWIGSDESRICSFNRKTGTSHHYRLDIPLSGIEIRTLYEDTQGNIWFGTIGGGLHVYSRKSGTFQSFTKKDGLSSNIIFGILEDDHQNLWLSTTNGLIKFKPELGVVKTYYKENGLQSNQFTYGFYKSKEGIMYFGGINGVTAFHPDSLLDNNYIPPVIITKFSIFNRPVEIGVDNNILQKDISETHSITLSYRHSVFSFEFSALNYCIPEQNQYAYMLEGFNKDWTYIGDRRYITYTNLGHGSYTLRIKAANNDGIWNEDGVSLQIEITPPFYQTWWFRLLIIILIAFVIKHIYNDRKSRRNLQKAKALANLEHIKLLRNQMNPHFLFNALSSIRSMITINKDQAWEMVSALSEFFRYTLINFNRVESVLNDEINAVKNYLNIENIRFKDTLEVSYKIDNAARQCHVPTFLFQPLVENAIKHGMHSSPMPLKILIEIHYKDRVLSIDVSNTGKLSETKEDNAEDASIHGTSLENIKKRLELMFHDKYTFTLFENKGWVHVKIRINYEKITEFDDAIIHEETEFSIP